MAGAQQTTQATQIEQQRLGYNGITLTNFTDATSAPAIASGSKVEVNTSLFFFGSDESISNWASVGNDTAGFIKLTVAGTDVTASFTETAPIWSESKQGYYASAASTERYIGGVFRATAAAYENKWLYQSRWKFGIDSANSEMSIEHPGLIIKQGASDTGVLLLHSTDIDHGLTSIAPTNVYAKFMKNDATGGGIRLDAITDGDETTSVVYGVNAYSRDTANTADNETAIGLFTFNAKQHDGSDVATAVAAAGNLFTFRNEDLGILSIKGNGDITFNAAANTDHTITFATDASILWDESEDEYYFNKSIKVDDGIETDGSKLKTKIVQIGEWDMDTDGQVVVANGTVGTIISEFVTIVPDNFSNKLPLDIALTASAVNGFYTFTTAQTTLDRITGGFFDSNLFEGTASTVPNRGWITIIHQV